MRGKLPSQAIVLNWYGWCGGLPVVRAFHQMHVRFDKYTTTKNDLWSPIYLAKTLGLTLEANDVLQFYEGRILYDTTTTTTITTTATTTSTPATTAAAAATTTTTPTTTAAAAAATTTTP